MAYSNDRATQIIVSLLKQHKIRKVVASPGTTNFALVATLQQDNYFEIVSSVDERSAAYIACGMSATSGEPVVLTCTGATASRNYLSGLTEAYYRKLPILAITGCNGAQHIGQMLPQSLDRNPIQHDVALLSVEIPLIKDEEDAAYCNRQVNSAMLELTRHGCGPVHINLSTAYTSPFTTFSQGLVPKSRCISHYSYEDDFPNIAEYNKIAVFIGAHTPMNTEDQAVIDTFAESHNVVVLVDHTSNYSGPYSVLSTLAADNISSYQPDFSRYVPDLVIHIGEVSGDYPTQKFIEASKAPVWRVSLDGKPSDRFNTLTKIFECSEKFFFKSLLSQLHLSDATNEVKRKESHEYFETWGKLDTAIRSHLPDIPFSNRWIAKRLSPQLPDNAVAHFAILNSLRSWNNFPYARTIEGFSNTGGFGIDGALSTMLGSSLASPDVLHFLFIGDLAFFYDMNSLGNRSIGSNIRILLVNNGTGVEFHMDYSPAVVLKEQVDAFVAATGHFASRDRGRSAAQAWSEAMGFTYLKAESKSEFEEHANQFLSANSQAPIVFECFTLPEDESAAGEMLHLLNPSATRAENAKKIANALLPKKAITIAKRILRR
jgi:2-succinyl-5-enolpyruvyl-6-hydroxy-3-cyclohexene-1-carboxylate synthase